MAETTVRSMQSSIQSMDEYIQTLRRLVNVMDAQPSVCEQISKAVGEKISTYTLNGACNTLKEYRNLMQDALDNTIVKWPPDCK